MGGQEDAPLRHRRVSEWAALAGTKSLTPARRLLELLGAQSGDIQSHVAVAASSCSGAPKLWQGSRQAIQLCMEDGDRWLFQVAVAWTAADACSDSVYDLL